MKQFTKICLMIAASVGGLGVVCLLLGLLLGANIQDLEGSSVIRIDSVRGKNGEYHVEQFHYDSNEKEKTSKEETQRNSSSGESNRISQVEASSDGGEYRFDCEKIDKIELVVDTGIVSVYENSDNSQILLYADGKKIQYKEEGNTLKIVDKQKNKNGTIELYLPGKAWKEIDMELGACKATIDSLTAGDISIELGAGEVEIGNLEATLEAELMVGAGEISVGRFQGNHLDLECGMGSMQVNCEGNQEDYNYSLECGIGKIRIGENTYTGLAHEQNWNNQSCKSMEIKCGVGEISLDFLKEL